MIFNGFRVVGRLFQPHQGNPSGTETLWGPDTYTIEIYVCSKTVSEATTKAEGYFNKTRDGFAHVASCIECEIPVVIE